MVEHLETSLTIIHILGEQIIYLTSSKILGKHDPGQHLGGAKGQ